MSHLPTKLTARLAALVAASTLASLAVGSAQAASPSTRTSHAAHPKKIGHHRVGKADWGEQVIYSFQGGSDGSEPWGDLVQTGGALYSTTLLGGAGGVGTVFKLAPAHGQFTESVVHTFAGSADGAYPWQGLTSDIFGSLYGLTGSGGSAGAGTAYKLTSKGQATIYSFQGGTDGSNPTGSPNEDLLGNVFGTTETGGATGNGTVFAMTPTRTGYSEQVLYSFKGGSDGQTPHGALLEDLFGGLYGTTYTGGTGAGGTVFKLTPSFGSGYHESVLHSFNGIDGAIPNANLIEDITGSLYGTATFGGTGQCSTTYDGFSGCGTVFKLTPTWNGYTETTLYSFQGTNDGAAPNGGLYKDIFGNIYGTTYYGGANNAGIVFELTPQRNGTYAESVVWTFGSQGDGAHPAGAVLPFAGALYGTTRFGGTINQGTVFSLTP